MVDGINKNHKNPRSLSKFSLSHSFTATTKIEEALAAPFVLLTFPAAALSSLCAPLAQVAPGSIVISAIKGFEDGTLFTPLERVATIAHKEVFTSVLSGPSFALDIIEGKPAGVVAASRNEETAKNVAALFSGRNLKVYLSSDPKGVEIGGAVKNVIALAAGVGDGLGLGDSARAGLITRGLAEVVRLGLALGAHPNTLYGLSGLGDLVMTSTSEMSRNRTVGVLLGKGRSLSAALAEIGSVVEGVHTAPLLLALGKKHGVELPITEQMTKLLRSEISPQDAVKALISRPIRREF